MKRLVLLLFCCMLLGGSVCSAKIFEKQDEFTGGKIIRSGVSCGAESNEKIERISLCKIISAKQDSYKILVKSKGLDRFTVSREDIQMNIDGRETYKIISTNRMDSVIGGDHVVALDYTVENNVRE